MRSLAGSLVAGWLPSGLALNLLAPVLPHLSITISNKTLECEDDTTGSFRRSSSAVGSAFTCTATASTEQRRVWPTVDWRRLSTTARDAAEPLRSFQPSTGAAPLPSSDTCPTLEALDTHIQHHSYQYSLRHVAAGLTTLCSLAPENAAAAVAAAAPAPSTQPAAPIAVDVTPAAASIADCARRLALLGRHQMKAETDVEAMAQCLRGFAGLALPLPARAQLAVPFVKRLRDPAYFYALRDQPAPALIQLLSALSRLPLYKHVQRSDIAPITQVLARLVVGLTPQVAVLSAADACRTTAALVRLGCSPERREAELYLNFIRALATHVRLVLLEQGGVSPDHAVRLLWAYAVLAPGCCGPSGGGGEAGGALPAPLADSPGAAARGAVIPQMVAALSRMACRGLDSHPPLELVKVVYALPALGAQQEAEAVLPRVTSRLLRELDGLDTGALADVAISYHQAHVHEPGLMQAIADRVLEVERSSPLSSKRVIRQLMTCYGTAGSHDDPALRELLQRASREHLPPAPSDTGDLLKSGPAAPASNVQPAAGFPRSCAVVRWTPGARQGCSETRLAVTLFEVPAASCCW